MIWRRLPHRKENCSSHNSMKTRLGAWDHDCGNWLYRESLCSRSTSAALGIRCSTRPLPAAHLTMPSGYVARAIWWRDFIGVPTLLAWTWAPAFLKNTDCQSRTLPRTAGRFRFGYMPRASSDALPSRGSRSEPTMNLLLRRYVRNWA